MSGQTPVVERVLPNGLKVLLRESHDAPVASFWVWYRVGSRNESPGLTGLSHWVEHMQFKGTPSIAKGAIFRDVSKHGGTLNALTSHDWTAYFETLPVDRLDLALAIESDRMTNSLFDPAETESERTVILSERQGAENGPTYLLAEQLMGAAFQAHPYRHMVIGYENDLRAITRDDLYDHYRRYYLPNNAIVVAAGDFQADDLFAKIESAFGGIAPGPPPPPVRVVEPKPLGERRLTLHRPAPTSYLRIAYHTPASRHPDTAALLVADAVLSGGKGMGLGGGGPMGRSARLYRALVATGLARGAGSDFDLYLDPFLFTLGVTALPGVAPDRIERALEVELDRLANEPVPEDELARAMKQVRAQYVYSAEGVTNQAFWLGQMEIVDRYQRAETLVDELAAITPDDVQRVVQTYLRTDARTIGWLIPDGDGGGGHDAATEAVAVRRQHWWGFGFGNAERTAPEGMNRVPFERRELANGMILLGQARPDTLTVVGKLRIAAGANGDPEGLTGLAAFTARMLNRGTAGRTFAAFNEATDALGASLSVDPGRQFVEVSLRCLREDLAALLDIAADVIRRPTFPSDELEKVRQELLSGVRESDNDTRATADRTMRRLLYPAGHPYARRVGGETETIAAITRDDLVAFHAAHYAPNLMTVAVVGGFRDLDQLGDLLDERFGDWDVRIDPPPPVAPAVAPNQARRGEVAIAGKSQSDLAIAYPTPPRSDPDYYALETANLILGRLGLMGRLGANVRDAQGLAYSVYSQLEAGKEGGVWVGRAGTNPMDVDRAVTGITSELGRLRDEGVTAEELADAQSYLTGVLPLALERADGVAALLLSIEYHDLGLDYLLRYPAIINGLTREALQAAARTHLDPERLVIGIAGPERPVADAALAEEVIA